MKREWDAMSQAERQDARFEKWISRPDLKFKNSEAKTSYKARAARIKDAVQLKKSPDRVPLCPLFTFMPGFIYGVKPYDMMYDPEIACSAFKRYLENFEPDLYFTIEGVGCGKAMDLLDCKNFRWPGHGVSADSIYQFVEGEYMNPDEYDEFLMDMSGFELRKLLSRTSGAFSTFNAFPPMGTIAGPHNERNLGYFGMPETQKALKALLEAGQAALEWITRMDRFRQETEETGFACVGFPCAIAPFDYFADLLRGSRGVMMDLFRRPDKLLAAMEKIIPLMINGALSAVTEYNNPLVFMPLHKGADGWMSDEQFRKFYWPSLKSIIIGLTDQGCVPLLFAEGGYNSRIEYINELPKGSCIWFFDRTDMKKAKEVIGANTCIMGNVPSGLILTSTPEKVGEYCKDLIDTVGKDGGYIMAAGTALDEVNADNLRAMFDTTREYGRY